MSVKKYFIALLIPEPFQQEIMLLKNQVKEKFGSKAALRSPAHITLHMPFEWKEEKESALIQILEQFLFPEVLPIALHDFSGFEPRVIYIQVRTNEQLSTFQKNLVSHVKKNLFLFNQANDLRGFHPHVTIAFRDLKKTLFFPALQYFTDQKFSAAFPVNSFCLLKQDDNKWQVYKEFVFIKPCSSD